MFIFSICVSLRFDFLLRYEIEKLFANNNNKKAHLDFKLRVQNDKIMKQRNRQPIRLTLK